MLSVVIPAFNEEATVERTAEAISKILLGGGRATYELVFIDDGSSDGTWDAILRAHERDRNVRGVSFSRNFGKDRAVFAGLAEARGDCVAVMDCDLQHPPEKLPEMYDLWRQGFEIVEGVKRDRGEESAFRKMCAGAFNFAISRLMKLDMKRSSDFKLMDRKVVDTLLAMPEEDVFFRGLTAFVGYRRAEVEFDVAERTGGASKWSFRSLARYAVSSVTAFSTAPLYLSAILGVLFGLVAVVTGILYATVGNDANRWLVFLGVMGLLAAACVLMCLGVMGYYLGRTFRQSLGRPRFVISRRCGE